MHDTTEELATRDAALLPASELDRALVGLAPPMPRIGPRLEVLDEGWQSTEPAPWRRYCARVFDITTLGVLGWELAGIAVGTLSPALHSRLFDGRLSPMLLALASPLLLAPLSALLLGTTGSTPGKWLFGTRVTRRNGRPIGLSAALGREVRVWFAGLGLGMPLVNLVTMLVARTRLMETHATSWDAGRPWVVTHRETGPLQWTLAVVAFFVWLLLRTMLTTLE